MLRNSYKLQKGQSLIETMVAVFILVMGITAALGLANYSLGATTTIRKQIIAMGLAREGIEAVKNMRDTNWLQANVSATCYDYLSGTNVAACYPNWLNPGNEGSPGYDIRPGDYALSYDTGTTAVGFWALAARTNNYGLNYDNSASPQHGLYSSWTPVSTTNASSDFSRRIVITEDTDAPFDRNLGPRIKVSSQVWWQDKGCPTEEVPSANNNCLITLETYLTNWKDY
jgi:hypothetical protein